MKTKKTILKKHFVILFILAVSFINGTTQAKWENISSDWIDSMNLVQDHSYLSGCAGAYVNRLTGDLYINIIFHGIWKSSDFGKTYVRIDQNTVNGNVSANGVQCDQDNPERMAIFSIDGSAGYTSDGINWKKMTSMGRNWDMGVIDWSSPDPKVLIACPHSNDPAMLSTDGAVTWNPMNIKPTGSGALIGIIDSTTFIYSSGNGINRSIDQGANWSNVSSVFVTSKVAVSFKGVCYVGTNNGLMTSKDKGATWESQGSPIEIIQGPRFGGNEDTLVIVNNDGMYRSTDAGTTWKLLTTLTKGNSSTYSIDDFTCTNLSVASYAWDFISNTCYVAALTNSALKKGPIDIEKPSVPGNLTASHITSTKCTLSWTGSTDNVGILLYEIFQNDNLSDGTLETSIEVNNLTPSTTYTFQVKAVDAEGNFSTSDQIVVNTLSTGIGSTDFNQEIIIYPNPASDLIAIKISEKIIGTAIIYDATGIKLGETKIETNPLMIDISAIPKGFYIVKIASEHSSASRSFFKY